MLSWILTSTVIGAFSAAILELFRDCTTEGPHEMRPSFNNRLTWSTMTDADVDALLQEFSSSSDATTAR